MCGFRTREPRLARNLVSKKVLRSDGTERRWLTRENAADAKPGPERSDRTWPRVLAVTVSEWRLHVWLCGAFLVLIVRLSVSSFGQARTYTTANPPSSATSRRENCAAPTEMTREKKGTTSHHRPTMTLVPGIRSRATRVKVKRRRRCPLSRWRWKTWQSKSITFSLFRRPNGGTLHYSVYFI